MSNKGSRSFRYTALALKFLEKILGSKFSVEGLENLPNKPILFVANHFTRSETFIVPYLIYKYSRRQVRCLADSSLFHGALGRFLSSVGTMSTHDPKRNETIISDLMTGDYDWMIYPEGSMVKSKEISNDGKFIINTPFRVGRTRTGSAVLALKSELYRLDYIDALKKGRQDVVDCYRKDYLGGISRNLDETQTYIVPVNITYYPIRPGNNKIKELTQRFFKKLPKQIAEEIEIEGNLLLSAQMNICFGKAISVANYVSSARNTVYQIPIIKNETKNNLIIRYLKYRLTYHFMTEIYQDTLINIDHIFSAILHHYPYEEIEIDHLKNLIFFSSIIIANTNLYRLEDHLNERVLFKILCDKKHPELDSIIKLALMLGIIKLSEDKKSYLINKEKLEGTHDFHNIRLENTTQVIANEFFLLERANDIVKRNCFLDEGKVKEKVFNYLVDMDLDIFEEDYKKYFEVGVSKDKSVGAPLFLNSNHPNNSKIGVVLIHGYLSAPKEVEQLAYDFNNLGFKTYSVRLVGHGTAPVNLRDVTWQDWQNSVLRGYAALKTICQEIIFVGFSTGGLLSLLVSADENSRTKTVISINTALKINDFKARLVPGINVWNDVLGKFHIEKGKLEYVKNTPEDPQTNYSKNYLKGVEQLGLLISECEDYLPKITLPVLFINSKNDPVVDSEACKMAIGEIGSKIKEFSEINSNRHVIISGKIGKEVFSKIKGFLENLNFFKNPS